MEGVIADTVWTWNAIGKRAGAWNLDAKSPEVTKGFLLNHLISDLLPVRDGGYRHANADPITGQAAWYDLRVRVERAADDAPERLSAPRFEALGRPANLPTPAATNRYGAQFKKAGEGDD